MSGYYFRRTKTVSLITKMAVKVQQTDSTHSLDLPFICVILMFGIIVQDGDKPSRYTENNAQFGAKNAYLWAVHLIFSVYG